MFAVIIERVRSGAEPVRRKVFGVGEVTIGRHLDNDLVLSHKTVAMHDSRLRLAREEITVIPLVPGGGASQAPRRVTGSFAIGVYQLRVIEQADVEPMPIDDPVERQLLAAIAARDEASRVVYADWLESRGELVRADFLRVQARLDTIATDDPKFARLTDHLRELASHVDLAWRARVARPAIEGCTAAFDFQCPKEWGALDATGDDEVRFCGSCKQDVHYAANVAEARVHAERGECVALDITSARWESDLDAPFEMHVCPQCALDVGPALFECPKCGARVRQRMMMRGRMVPTRS
ncbi:MAG TPA: TIGR02996 domain-containing protein [Kofleriaceae bacterium]